MISDCRFPIADGGTRSRATATSRCALLLALAAAGCSSDSGTAPPRRPPPARPNRQSATRNRRSRNPLAFAADTLEGWRFDFAERNARRRILVYLVDPTAPRATRTTAVAQRIHRERHAYNLTVVAVVVPPGYKVLAARRLPTNRPSRQKLAALARRHLADAGAAIPCVVDPHGAIVERYVKAWGRYRLDALPAFYAFPVQATGPTGRPVFGHIGSKSAERLDYTRRRVLKQFAIEATADVDPLAGHHPPAPDIALTDTAGRTHRLREHRGRLVVFVLIAQHCPRCKDELRFLLGMLAAYGRAKRKEGPWLELLAVCTDASGERLEQMVAERGYTFPVGADTDWAIRSAFRYRGATPDTFVVAPDGRIRYRHRGFTDELEPVLHMEIRTLLGLDTRPLLSPDAYGSDEACRICHPRQYADWALTRHACAWDTLVRLGKDDDPACARCHVVGHGERGGFVSKRRTPQLRNVQCESCHGRNGCKAFAGGQAKPVAAAACAPCHDAVHSPRFRFATHRPRVLHDRADQLARLPRAEREQRLRRLCSGAGQQLFDPDTPYVGSAACARCHPTEAKALEGGPHARALALLATPARDHWSVPAHKRGIVGIAKPPCIRCHVTGHGRPGGFPARAPAAPLEHPMAGVGCEACHGPGKAHADDPKKPRAIARLGGTCPECNILPICRQCHDDANSPDFDYKQALPRAVHPVGKAIAP